MKDRIRQLMEAQHMNQQAFAKFTNIGTASLSSIFTGRTRPTMNHVIAIMNAFPNVNPTWLIKGEGGMMLTEQSSSAQNSENFSPNEGADNFAQTSPSEAAEFDAKNTDNMTVDLPLFNNPTPKSTVHPSVLPPVSASSSEKYSKMSRSGGALVVPQVTGHRKITEIRVFLMIRRGKPLSQRTNRFTLK